jgi:hypothetical protein
MNAKSRVRPVEVSHSFAGAGPGGFDLAAQGAADQFRNAQFLAPRFVGQDFSGLSR